MTSQQRLTHISRPEGVTPGPGYSHVVTGPGRLVAVSGQVAIGEDGQLVGPGDPSAQARQVFENLRRCLAAAGLSFDDVMKLTCYVTDVADLPAVRAVRDEFIDTARPPAPRCRWWRWPARSSCWRWRRSRWPGTAASGGRRAWATEGGPMKFNHVGIPTAGAFDGEIPLPHLKMTVSDHLRNPFGIQWQRYWDGAPYPDLVKTVPHVAFEVDDLAGALEGHHIITEPNSPSPGVVVAFIEVSGAPVELMQIDHEARPEL